VVKNSSTKLELQWFEQGTGVWGSHKPPTFAGCCPENVQRE